MTETISKMYCDICHKEITRPFGKLNYSHHVRDYLGNLCAKYEKECDCICEECCNKIDGALLKIFVEREEK